MMEAEAELYGVSPNKVKAFVEKNAEEALSLLNDRESSSLSAICLSGKETFLTHSLLSSYCRRGFIKDLGSDAYSLTELGEKAAALYPLLGTYSEKHRVYESEFFSMALSLVSTEHFSSKRSAWMRALQKDEYLSIFPSRDKERVKRALIKCFERFIELNIIDETEDELTLSKDSALSFFSLSEINRLSYMLTSEENRDKALFALTLAFKLNIEEDKLDYYLGLIHRITDYSLDKEFLFDFDILRNNDGYISGADLKEEKTQSGIISSDFTLTYTSLSSLPLFLFLKAEKDDKVKLWRITKESIKAAFDYGFSLNEVLASLESLAELPKMVEQRIESWWNSYSKIKIRRALVLETDEKSAKLLDSLKEFNEFVLYKSSPTLFFMDEEKEERWRDMLIASGFEMLQKTQGAKKTEVKETALFENLKEPRLLPEKREIDFSQSAYDEVIASSYNLLDKALSERGIRFKADMHYMPALISGFNYPEKLGLVTEAIKQKLNIYSELADNRELIFTPLSLEKEGDELIIETKLGNRIPLSILYKTAAVDRAIKANA